MNKRIEYLINLFCTVVFIDRRKVFYYEKYQHFGVKLFKFFDKSTFVKALCSLIQKTLFDAEFHQKVDEIDCYKQQTAKEYGIFSIERDAMISEKYTVKNKRNEQNDRNSGTQCQFKASLALFKFGEEH